MPLFAAKVRVTCEAQIPIFAKDIEEARAYFKSTREWTEDGVFEAEGLHPISYEPTEEVIRIESPKLSPWDGEAIVWNNDDFEMSAGVAFFSEELHKTPYYAEGTDEDEDEKDFDALAEAQFALEDEAEERFDAQRNAPATVIPLQEFVHDGVMVSKGVEAEFPDKDALELEKAGLVKITSPVLRSPDMELRDLVLVEK